MSLERLPNVVAVTPNVWGNAEVEGNGRMRRTMVYGVNADLPRIFQVDRAKRPVSAGRG